MLWQCYFSSGSASLPFKPRSSRHEGWHGALMIMKALSGCNWWGHIHLIPLLLIPKADTHHLSLCWLKSFRPLPLRFFFGGGVLFLCCLSQFPWAAVHHFISHLICLDEVVFYLRPNGMLRQALSLFHSIASVQCETINWGSRFSWAIKRASCVFVSSPNLPAELQWQDVFKAYAEFRYILQAVKMVSHLSTITRTCGTALHKQKRSRRRRAVGGVGRGERESAV